MKSQKKFFFVCLALGLTAAFFAKSTKMLDILFQHPDFDINFTNRHGHSLIFYFCLKKNCELVEHCSKHPKLDFTYRSKGKGFDILLASYNCGK